MPYPFAGLAVVAVLQGTEPEDWQEILAIAGLPELSEFMIYLYITDGPESLLAHHLASIARDAFAYWANNRSLNGADFAKRHFFHMTAIDHAEISVKTPLIAGVAQLVEHPICNRAVGSSSLSASTISPIASCVNTLICRHIICLQVMTDAQSDVHKCLPICLQ